MGLINFITDNVWLTQTIITGLLIPLLIIPINLYFSIIFKKLYLHAQVKDKYKAFLMEHSRSVDDLCYILYKYKYDTSIFTRIIFFIEGGLVGIICWMQLGHLFSYISELRGFNGLFPFLLYYNLYHDVILFSKNIDFLYLVASFNIFSVIISGIISILMLFFISKHYNEPQFKESFILTKWSRFFYHSYSFLIGVLIGINFWILVFTIGALANFHSVDQKFSFGFSCFIDIWTNLKIQIPTYGAYLIILMYLLGIFISVRGIILLYQTITSFSFNFKKKVKDFYIDKLPYIRIKTEFGDFSGQLNDIQNKSLLTLSEGEVLKAVPWDQIKVIEIKKSEDGSKPNIKIFPETTENRSWWKFW